MVGSINMMFQRNFLVVFRTVHAIQKGSNLPIPTQTFSNNCSLINVLIDMSREVSVTLDGTQRQLGSVMKCGNNWAAEHWTYLWKCSCTRNNSCLKSGCCGLISSFIFYFWDWYSIIKFTIRKFFKIFFWRSQVMEPLIPLFWTSGDICSG